MDFILKMNPKKFPTLKSDEIHIWSASLSETKNNVAYLASLLSEDEHERANSFKFPIDRNQYIIARGILRSLIAGYLGGAPQAIEIIYGLWGKPCLAREKFFRFNISHSRDYALYAVTKNYEVGVDLEYIDKNLELDGIALNIFSPLELDYWKNLSPENKIDFFFRFWVCKEAYLKALGKGWLDSKKEIPFEKVYALKKQKRDNLLKNNITYPYYFECILDYASALFIEGPPLHQLHYIWSQGKFTI